jgi:hypothetical protein
MVVNLELELNKKILLVHNANKSYKSERMKDVSKEKTVKEIKKKFVEAMVKANKKTGSKIVKIKVK